MRRLTRSLLAGIAGLVTLLAVASCAAAPGGDTDDDAPSVVLSNAFIGNQWRQSMVKSFEKAAAEAQADGLISSYKVTNAPGQNSATDQIAQLKTIILERPDILLINPASPTALAPVVTEACELDITVVVFDSGIENDCAYVVTNSFEQWGRVSTSAIAESMGGEGKLLISRGVVGSAPDAEFYAAQMDVLKDYPDIDVVGEVNGYCSSPDAQKAVVGVLSSLPDVEAVAGCGDGFGIAQAFKSAGRDLPILAFEPSGRALRFWAENDVPSGAIGMMSDPGESAAALYTAIELVNGAELPRTTLFPPVFIAEEDRDTWLDVVGEDEIAAWPWTAELVHDQLQANINGTVDDAPLPPVPSADD